MTMKLEFHHISGEDVPVILLDCDACGEQITIIEKELKTSRPVECTFCSHSRQLSYREYVTITDKFAATLLGFLVGQYNSGKRIRHRLPC
jgi:hypothetical protein